MSHTYQLAIPSMLDGINMVPVTRKRKGVNPLKLSQTKLEMLIQYLLDPSKEVLDPRNIALPQHLSIVAGLAMHEIAQITSLWRYLQPKRTSNYRQNYYDKVSTLRHLIPTAHPIVVKRMMRYLSDSRLPMPKVRNDNFIAAKREVYRIITQYVLEWLITQPPFATTPAFPEFAHHQNFDWEIPFPDPKVFKEAWYKPNHNKLNWDDKVHLLTQNLFDWHENAIVTPVDFTLRYGGAFHEVRYNSVYPKYGLVWSGRFDLLVFKQRLKVPERIIHLIDFKSGNFSLPSKDSLAHQILRASTWLSVQASLDLPQELNSDGKSVRLFPPISSTNFDTEVKVDYISLHQSPPKVISLDQPFAYSWMDDSAAYQMIAFIESLVARINLERERFAPILGETKLAKEAKLLRSFTNLA